MFNFSGSEMVFLLLLALIILGPEKLPDAVRKFGKTYAEFKKVTTGFQTELRSALDEPMKEMRETADVLRKAANFDAVSDVVKPTSGSMAAATPAEPRDLPAAQAVQPPFGQASPAHDDAAHVADPTAVAPPPVEPSRPPGPAFNSAAPAARPSAPAEPTTPPVEAAEPPGQEEPTA